MCLVGISLSNVKTSHILVQIFSTLTPLADVNFILMLHGVAANLFIFLICLHQR